MKFDAVFCYRFIGSAKVNLKDLASGQVKSLSSKGLPLVNESGQNIGVSASTFLFFILYCFGKKKQDLLSRNTNS